MAITDERKRQIMDHLARTSGDYVRRSRQTEEEKRRRVLEHVQQTRG